MQSVLPLLLLLAQAPDERAKTAPAMDVPRNRVPVIGYTLHHPNAVSPDGKRLLCSHFDHTTRFHDVATGKELFRLPTGKSWVRATAIAPDGKSMATGTEASVVQVWSTADGKLLHTFEGKHKKGMRRVVYTPDSKLLLGGCEEGVLCVWDLQTGKLLHSSDTVKSRIDALGVAPDGKRFVTVANSGRVNTWDVATGKEVGSFVSHKRYVRAAAVSPDAKLVATVGKDDVFGKDRESCRLWDVATGKVVARPLGIPEGSILNARFSPDGKLLSLEGADSGIYLWDVANKKRLAALPIRGDLLVLSGGKTALACDTRARLIDLETRQERGVVPAHTGRAYSVQYSPDGKVVLTAGEDGKARIWDATTGAELRVLEGHKGAVNAARFAPDGKSIATCGDDKTVRIWDAATGKEKAKHEGGTDKLIEIAFSPDGKTLAVKADRGTVQLWDAATGKAGLSLPGRMMRKTGLAFSPDGKFVTGGGESDRVNVWDAATGKVVWEQQDKSYLTSCLFTPDRKVLVKGSFSKVQWLDGTTGKELASYDQPGTIYALASSADGKRLATGAHTSQSGDTVVVREAKTGKPLAKLVGHAKGVQSLCFSPDGRRLASVDDEGLLFFWDVSPEK